MENLKLIIFCLALSLLFPVFGYAFTVFGTDPISYDISLTEDQLIDAGVFLGYAESNNVTYKGGWVYFSFNKTDLRVRWKDSNFLFQVKALPSRITGGWLFTRNLWVIDVRTNAKMFYILNETVITSWNNDFNYTRFKLENGYEVFFTYPEPQYNITYWIQDQGKITITIGENLEHQTKFNLRSFVNWYLGLFIGDITYGYPPFISWILRILVAFNFLGAVIVIKELVFSA